MKTLLLVLDMQNGLLKRNIYRKESLIKNIYVLVSHFSKLNDSVVFTQQTNDSTLKKGSSPWKIIDDFSTFQNVYYLDKREGNIFKEAKLDYILERNKIKCIVICGLFTSSAVQMAVVSSINKRYETVLVEDAHSTVVTRADESIDGWNVAFTQMGAHVMNTRELVTYKLFYPK